MNIKQKYYDLLEIDENATIEDIKKAHRKKAMEYHPDRNSGFQKEAEKKMKEINEAKEYLIRNYGKKTYEYSNTEKEKKSQKDKKTSGNSSKNGNNDQPNGIGKIGARLGRVCNIIIYGLILLILGGVTLVGLFEGQDELFFGGLLSLFIFILIYKLLVETVRYVFFGKFHFNFYIEIATVKNYYKKITKNDFFIMLIGRLGMLLKIFLTFVLISVLIGIFISIGTEVNKIGKIGDNTSSISNNKQSYVNRELGEKTINADSYKKCLSDFDISQCFQDFGFLKNSLGDITEFYKVDKSYNYHTAYIKKEKKLYFYVNKKNNKSFVNIVYPEQATITVEGMYVQPIFSKGYLVNDDDHVILSDYKVIVPHDLEYVRLMNGDVNGEIIWEYKGELVYQNGVDYYEKEMLQNTNFRESTNTSSEVISIIKKGTTIKVSGQYYQNDEGKWYEIEYMVDGVNKVGYINEVAFKSDKELGIEKTTSRLMLQNTNFRSGTNTSSNVIALIKKGTYIDVSDNIYENNEGKWYGIDYVVGGKLISGYINEIAFKNDIQLKENVGKEGKNDINYIDPNKTYFDCGVGGTYSDYFKKCNCDYGYKTGSDGKCNEKPDCGVGGTYSDYFKKCNCDYGFGKLSDGKCYK